MIRMDFFSKFNYTKFVIMVEFFLFLSKMFAVRLQNCLEIFMYSSVPNRRACTFINFEKKIHPARSYFSLHVY